VFEISPSPQTPSNAVDNLIYVQETIKTIASKLNFHATFHPEAFVKSYTVAQHVYLSINEAEEEQDHPSRQRRTTLPALGTFFLGGYDSWGIRDENRGYGDVALGDKQARPDPVKREHWEHRVPDLSRKPILSTHRHPHPGSRRNDRQEAIDDQGEYVDPIRGIHPGSPSKAELGVTERLPKDFEGALGALKADSEVSAGRWARNALTRTY